MELKEGHIELGGITRIGISYFQVPLELVRETGSEVPVRVLARGRGLETPIAEIVVVVLIGLPRGHNSIRHARLSYCLHLHRTNLVEQVLDHLLEVFIAFLEFLE